MEIIYIILYRTTLSIMAPKKIKIVDMSLNNTETNAESMEAEPVVESQLGGDNDEVYTECLEHAAIESRTEPLLKTVELVECPDCGKKMTAKTLKYSHSKTCSSKKQQECKDSEKENVTHSVLPVGSTNNEDVEPLQSEVKDEELPQPTVQVKNKVVKTDSRPKLTRTISEKVPVKKLIENIEKTRPQPQQPSPVRQHSEPNSQPTLNNIYGREHRNARIRLRSERMQTLFFNAI